MHDTQTWTADNIYAGDTPASMRTIPPTIDPDEMYRLRLLHRSGIHDYAFDPAYVADLIRETRWVRVGRVTLPALDAETQERIGRGQTTCPICHGSGVLPILHRGGVTGIEVLMPTESCICRVLQSYWRVWAESVPTRYQHVRLGTLRPSPPVDRLSCLPVDQQAKIIATLREHPSDSYLFFGAAGTGKTHMAAALYREAVLGWAKQEARQHDCVRAVWRCRVSTLMESYVDRSMRDRDAEHGVARPVVMVRDIEAAARAGYRPGLYLDEIDKFKPTEAQVRWLVELVDAVYEAHGQLVATCNMSSPELAAKWGDHIAATVLRRIGGGPGAHTIRFAA